MTRRYNFPLGDVIAERTLEWHKSDGTTVDVAVRFGKPVQDGLAWVCPYEISCSEWTRRLFGAGEDSMQALILGLRHIPSQVFALARKHGGQFTLYGEPDLGFPDVDANADG